ncbi:MAG TPA: cysteine desulfurase [Planctomycetaceae bacterium]|nr:cysteine desulfurase [Planctomycetaceae bacterium]|tara:strand:- start:1196 stop:2356 length:1161 start_codon:yes stop_codon:yes gene_type:complete
MTIQTTSEIYLDNNATTQPLPEVIEAVAQHLGESFGNPGSRHAAGRRARVVLEDSRETIARILGADPGEVIFTSGGTESTNLALFGLSAGNPGLVLTTAGEHPATTESITALAEQGWSSRPLQVDQDGRLLPDELTTLPWEDIRLATVILAHNETGVVQDLDPLSKACREHGVPLHVDAVQAVGKIPVDFHRLGATSLALGAHKFHGPRGIGALLLRDGCRLAPFEYGGHQESGRRPGTEVVALAAGMARALESWDADRTARSDRIQALRDRLQAGLEKSAGPTVVNGHLNHRLPNTLNIAFPGLDGEAILVALDLELVACSLGSTCSSGSAEPAPALVAMGRSEEVYRASVRFSVGLENTVEEIDEAVRRVSGVVARLRESAPVA